MAYAADWDQVTAFLRRKRAPERPYARSARGDVYYVPSTGEWIKVARNGAGFEVSVHASRAACGC